MKLKQLSVFLENKPGRLGHPCKALTDAGIKKFLEDWQNVPK